MLVSGDELGQPSVKPDELEVRELDFSVPHELGALDAGDVERALKLGACKLVVGHAISEGPIDVDTDAVAGGRTERAAHEAAERFIAHDAERKASRALGAESAALEKFRRLELVGGFARRLRAKPRASDQREKHRDRKPVQDRPEKAQRKEKASKSMAPIAATFLSARRSCRL